jgi:hypothetical protein
MRLALEALMWVGVAALGTFVVAFWVALVKMWRSR